MAFFATDILAVSWKGILFVFMIRIYTHKMDFGKCCEKELLDSLQQNERNLD